MVSLTLFDHGYLPTRYILVGNPIPNPAVITHLTKVLAELLGFCQSSKKLTSQIALKTLKNSANSG